MIEFYDDDGVLGTVRVEGEKLVADPVTQSYVDSWRSMSRMPSDFEVFYDGWSNGYVSARRVEEIDRDI